MNYTAHRHHSRATNRYSIEIHLDGVQVVPPQRDPSGRTNFVIISKPYKRPVPNTFFRTDEKKARKDAELYQALDEVEWTIVIPVDPNVDVY